MLASETRQFLLQLDRIAAAKPATECFYARTSVVIPAVDQAGFDIKVVLEPVGFIILFDEAMLEVRTHDLAIELVESALNGRIRVKIDAIAGKPWQWTAERLQSDGRWTVESVTGQFRFRLWRAATSHYKINGRDKSLTLARGGDFPKRSVEDVGGECLAPRPSFS